MTHATTTTNIWLVKSKCHPSCALIRIREQLASCLMSKFNLLTSPHLKITALMRRQRLNTLQHQYTWRNRWLWKRNGIEESFMTVSRRKGLKKRNKTPLIRTISLKFCTTIETRLIANSIRLKFLKNCRKIRGRLESREVRLPQRF